MFVYKKWAKEQKSILGKIVTTEYEGLFFLGFIPIFIIQKGSKPLPIKGHYH